MSNLIAEQIAKALRRALPDNTQPFTPETLLPALGVSTDIWQSDYAAVFEGMRTDRPATAPDSGARFRNVFAASDAGYTLTPYGRDLLQELQKEHEDALDKTLELPRIVEDQPIEPIDGLRAWQAAVVRLWSEGGDSYAELDLGWLPPESPDAPWIARLTCGDRAEEGWAEDARIVKATSPQQALQKLWDRAKARHGLFKEDAVLLTRPPTDFPADYWLTIAERALLDRAQNVLRRAAPKTAIRLSYHPERRSATRWAAMLHPFNVEPPEGVQAEVAGATLLQALDALNRAIEKQYSEAETPPTDAELLALMERKTDISLALPPGIPDSTSDDTATGL